MTIEPLPDHQRAPKPLSTGLDRVMRSLGLPSVDSLGLLFARWSEIVGDELANLCKPMSLHRGRLVIGAVDHAWATELRWMEKILIDRCAASLGSGVVTTVVVRVGLDSSLPDPR